ncbi:MAG: ABC transporter substrate-binding protein [Clostridia bacterium]|nr:ABC transporter substrate-binding protein [Clostridia bacterium]MBR0025840.1 ABC transporter substrate-binding protein [Clostridia bacterium]
MKKLPALLLALLLLTTVFFGCEGTVPLKTVVVNEVTRSVFYAPFYVAVEKGFFKEEGMDIEIITGGGSDKSMTALLSDQADAILAGPETNVYVVNEGREDHPIIVAQLTKRDGSFLVGRTAEEDFDWSKLAGKSIIGGRKGGMPFMTLLYVLKQNGLTPGEDVTVYDHIQFNLMGGAFEGGLGDYVTLFEPTASLFEAEGKGAIVSNVGLASGEVPYTTFMVTQSRIREDPEFVEAFVRAIHRGQQWVQTATDTEIAEAMAPYFPDADPVTLEYVAKSYRETDSWCTDPVMTADSYARLLDIMESAGELSARPEMAKLVDNSFAEAAIQK